MPLLPPPLPGGGGGGVGGSAIICDGVKPMVCLAICKGIDARQTWGDSAMLWHTILWTISPALNARNSSHFHEEHLHCLQDKYAASLLDMAGLLITKPFSNT